MQNSLLKRGLALFSDHWNGRNNFILTIAVTVLALRVAIGYVPKSSSFTIAALVMLASALILVWQGIGAVRATDKHYRASGNFGTVLLGYGAVMVAITLTCLQGLNQFAIVDEPKTWRLTSDKVSISSDRTAIKLKGDIDYPMFNTLKQTSGFYPAAKTVILESDGGLVYAARAIAKTITEKGLDTHVEKSCRSACSVVFLAGETRSMAKSATLGFHQYRVGNIDPFKILDVDEEQRKDQAFFLSRGVSSEFLERIFQKDNSQIWEPSREDLLAAGVITAN